MSELKYKVGDKVRINSIDWYNKNKDEDGDVSCGEFDFVEGMKKFCSETLTISEDAGDGYLMLEDKHRYAWTDEMIECKVEEETKTKFKVGDKVRIKDIDWYNRCTNGTKVNCKYYPFICDMKKYCGQIMTINDVRGHSYDMIEDNGTNAWTDEMFEELVEEGTPKFKVNDIVFVKNIGWVRITNSYWDSLANEYIYEAIGFNGEGEYDCISQSNIEGQMLPESENPHTGGNKITLDEYKNNDKEWLFNKLAMLDNITALESIQDIFNYLQQPKYPKTYEECCKILGLNSEITDSELLFYYSLKCGDYTTIRLPEMEKFEKFIQLYLCRNAYWKIAGEVMGLRKPWEPSKDKMVYSIYRHSNEIETDIFSGESVTFEFPTAEMRDAFKENFDPDIEFCKELL